MIAIVLNIIGLILITYSIYIIRKDIVNQKTVVNDLNSIEKRVKEYYNLTEEIIEGFDEIIDSKLEMINKENMQSDNKQLHSINGHDDNFIENSKVNTTNIDSSLLYNKIIELKKIGLSNEDIAKKLNKGVREIEIIFKIYCNKK